MVLKKAPGCVLASLRGSTYRKEYDSPLRSLRSCRQAFLNTMQGISVSSTIACHRARMS